jgi:hypothetical protein
MATSSGPVIWCSTSAHMSAIASPRSTGWVRAVSFEFTTIQRDVVLACIERCAAMGYARFNAALGESQTLIGEWMSAQDIARWLTELPQAANSGDIYAVAA